MLVRYYIMCYNYMRCVSSLLSHVNLIKTYSYIIKGLMQSVLSALLQDNEHINGAGCTANALP